MLTGLGLGPGNPELLTLRAVRMLKEADAVFVPGRIAQNLVEPYCNPVLLTFPMTEDESEIRRCLVENADRVAPAARHGLAVFGILGDPNFFSTFTRLCTVIAERYPAIRISTEPGISSITAFAAATGISLDGDFLVSAGRETSSLVLLKVKNPQEKAAELKTKGYTEFILVERMYLPDMRVFRNEDLPCKSDYLSVMFARR